MGRLNIALIALCTMACSSRTERPSFDLPPPQYDVVVDESFSPAQVTAIRLAVLAWSGRLGGEGTFQFRVEEFDRSEMPPPRTIRFFANPGAWKTTKLAGLTLSWTRDEAGRPYQASVWVDSQFDEQIFSLVAMHEMGHALGLKHSSDSESIMYPSINLYDPTNDMTCGDVKSLCDIWGCDPVCEL